MRFALFSRNKKARQPNTRERNLLTQFANCEISLAELIAGLSGMIEIDFGVTERRLKSHFQAAEPGIRIDLSEIEKAKSKNSTGELSNEGLKDWATMILLNDAYLWEGPDEEEIANRLHELSLPQIFLKTPDKQ